MDVLLTQRAIVPQVVEGGGDDVMVVKGNQARRLHAILLVFQEPLAQPATITACARVPHGHGRLEARRLTTSPALVGYRDWPSLTQGFQIERRVTVKKS